MDDPEGGDQPGDAAQQRAQYIGHAAAQAAHEHRCGNGGQRQPQLIEADGQRCQHGIAGKHLPDDAAQRNDDGWRGAAQRLGSYQQPHIALGIGGVGCTCRCRHDGTCHGLAS
ncbi:hypothetical protein SDC9_139420 [bioreactor metagenome]|uniref:Uncharacterized protein n=1 Tax=bioreactor metagenome TaxID=1076179 RepID=A0A645DSP4_9ZZZZ